MIASLFVKFITENEIEKSFDGREVGILNPNNFSVLVAIIAFVGLLIYPFIREN
jgi:hypothetical protein